MLKKIDKSECFFLDTYKQSEINDDVWSKIEYYKKTYIIQDSCEFKFNRYPGFMFSNDEAAELYYNNFYNNIENINTQPRGNLSLSSKYIFVGIRPGSNDIHSKSESCFLIGEKTAAVLNCLFRDLNIYGYYTNVYMSSTSVDINLTKILSELSILKLINNNLLIIFLGQYDEYDKIIDILKLENKKDYLKIWHPSYIMRSYTTQKYNTWLRSFVYEKKHS